MNIGYAMDIIKRGGKAYRVAWTAYTVDMAYAYLMLGEPLPGVAPCIIGVCRDGDKHVFNPSHMQLLADDWQEYHDLEDSEITWSEHSHP